MREPRRSCQFPEAGLSGGRAVQRRTLTRNKFAASDDDLSSLAAAYAFGISRNHPFVDDNKRSAFTALMIFLAINDIDFEVPEAHATVMMLALAAGEVGEEGLTRWIRDNWPQS